MRGTLFLGVVLACGGATTRPTDVSAPLPTVAASAAGVPPTPAAPWPAKGRGSVAQLRLIDGGANTTGGRMAMNAHGEIFLVGSFDGTLRFGDLPALASDDEDAFVLALDAAGKPMWSKRIGGGGLDYGDDVAVDATGVYVSGAFESKSIDLGAGPLRCAGVHDLFLAKYDFAGKLLWAKRYGDALDQIALRLRAHPDGGVVATGWYNGTIDFGAGPTHGQLPKASFVARIDASGHGRWSRAFGHRYDYAETDAVVDAAGHVFVSGGSEATSEFVRGGHPSARNDLGPVLLELDPNGKLVSAKRFGSGTDNVSTALALAPDGSLRFAAGSRGMLDFGGGPKRPVGYEEAVDVARFDAHGALAATTRVLSDRLASVSAVTVDARGDSVVVGDVLRHEAKPRPYGHDAGRGIVVSVAPSGAIQWTYVLDGGLQSGLSSVVVDARGRVLVSGMEGNAIALVTLEP